MTFFFRNIKLSNAIFCGFIGLVAGIFCSRFLLSISSIFLVAILFTNIKKVSYKKFFTWAVLCIVFLPLLSILWSDNRQETLNHFLVKIPLLLILLPTIGQLDYVKNSAFIYVLTAFTLVATIYTTVIYFNNFEQVNINYLKAKVMFTVLESDHIRFSWLVVLNMIVLGYQFSIEKNSVKRKVTIFLGVWLFFFLHILASKTGLLCLYITLIIVVFSAFKSSFKKSFLSILCLIILLSLCYKTIPSFHNRVQYVVYDFNQYSKGNWVEGLSDGARIISWKVGISIIHENIFFGVGFGDMLQQIKWWHLQHNSGLKDFEIFLPTNQFLIYALGLGLFGFFVFLGSTFVVLKSIFIGSIYKKLVAIILLVPLITDDTFEGQFGVAIFVLFYNLAYSIQSDFLAQTPKNIKE